MLELKQITKSFKKDFYAKKFVALDGISFSIKQGALVGFLGANGAGKTTSLKIILNFIKPDSGEITYPSSDGSYQNFLKNLGYLPERPYFHANLTGREFVRYMADLNDVKKNDYVLNLEKWSTRLKIDHALDRKLSHYSKGMLQRLGFVSCLIHDPSFLIFDEPVSGLDPIGRKEIKDVMLELNKSGKTIFFSSHIVSDIEEICQDLIVMDRGKIIYDGSVENILQNGDQNRFEAVVYGDDILNIKNVCEINKIQDKKYSVLVDQKFKTFFLNECLQVGIEILKLTNVRPSLEEIVYGNVKKNV